jgi:hypothetical protein
VHPLREHQDEDDKRVEKVVNDAVQGKMRMKKRDRGIGFEDDESDSEDEGRVRRPKLPKKRRIDGDTLDAFRTCSICSCFPQALIDCYDNRERRRHGCIRANLRSGHCR